MTCIVGVAQKGLVVIGADSAGVAGLSLRVRSDRKVFRNGEFVMGFTSSFRMGQLLAVRLVPPQCHSDTDIWRYMVGDFIDAVRSCLSAGGFSRKDNNVESGGTFLVGFRGRLFSVHDDFQVSEHAHRFAAAGCGEEYALGSLAETEKVVDPRRRCERALVVAERFSAGVRGPFHFEVLPAQEPRP